MDRCSDDFSDASRVHQIAAFMFSHVPSESPSSPILFMATFKSITSLQHRRYYVTREQCPLPEIQRGMHLWQNETFISIRRD